MNYLYDSSFEGFLTCVFHHWYTEKAEGIFPDGSYQLDLCRYAMTVGTDAEKAGRVLDAITAKLSKWDAQRVYQAFCSTEPEKEMKLLRYIALGFKEGSKIRLLHGDPVVKAVEVAERRVGLEVHRLCGLIRFAEVRAQSGRNGRNSPNSPVRPDSMGSQGGHSLLYAKIEPDNDVLEFLAPHFSDRYKSEPIVIHDLRREQALFAYHRKWEIAELAADAVTEKTESELGYSSLWKHYFDAMATKERVNPRCQRQFMPARYWKHLTEMG